MIEARHLTKRYSKAVAVDDVSFVVQPGRVTGFLGPNGAGKPASQERHHDHLVGHIHPHAGPARRRVARPLRPLRCPRSRRAGPFPGKHINGGEDSRGPG